MDETFGSAFSIGARSALAKLVDDQWEIVPCGVLADEHVEVSVAGDLVEGVAPRCMAVEKVQRALLTLPGRNND